jgi:hypothetical protein
MPGREDRALAAALADVLDGRRQPEGELAELARVLTAVATEARVDVPAGETERALRSVRPREARRRWPLPAAVAAACAVAVSIAVVLASPFASPTRVDVQARALAALGGPGSVLEVVERIAPGPAGGFVPSTRTGWIDPARASARWTQRAAGGGVVDETLVERGRITRYDPASGTAVIARSCAALATGCASAVDPIAVYRRALSRAAATAARPVRFRGRDAYRFQLPVQRLPDAVRIVQVVTVDAGTLLPERIVWREAVPGGRLRTAAVVEIGTVDVVPRGQAPVDAFVLRLPRRTSVTELAAPGRPVRLVATRTLSAARARALAPPLLWLGRRYGGHRLGRITLLRYNAGTAVRMDYGPLSVWNYGRVIPPALLANRLVPVKQFPIGTTTARLYATVGGRLAAELDRPAGGTAALLGPALTKESFFTALGRLRPMRR